MGHTKGPWTRTGLRIFDASNREIAGTFGSRGRRSIPLEEAEANAHLIAAAPDLLKSLEQMIADFGDSAGDDSEAKQVLADACAAVAKARPVEDEK